MSPTIHYLVCIENNLFIVGTGPIPNKELEFIYLSDFSDSSYVYIQASVLHNKF